MANQPIEDEIAKQEPGQEAGEIERQSRQLDTPEAWEKDFIEALINDYGVVGRAARAVGIHPKAVERRAKQSESFAALYRAALQITYDAMDYEAMRRALEPSERPVYQRGQLVGVIREWDNKHLQWMLERTMPEKYHLPTRVEFAGDGEGTINFKLELGPSAVEEEETEE